MRIIYQSLLVMCLFSGVATAGDQSNKESIQRHVNMVLENAHIDLVKDTPIDGIYEIQSGKKVFYSDKSGKFLFLGTHIIDVEHKKDLTKISTDALNTVDWSSLPLDSAVVSGDPNGKLKLAVFTDPECPYCRQLEGELSKLKGVKIYSFLYPLPFHKHARKWATAIWCAKDKHKMMMDIMLKNKDPEEGRCSTPINDIINLGRSLEITGTPTLISGDGRLTVGGNNSKSLMLWLLKVQ